MCDAVASMHSAIDDLVLAGRASGSGEYADILESYRMFAQDRGWLGRIREAILQGLSAEAAVERVQNEMRARLGQMTDPYFRERQHDLDDLTNRLLNHLAGKDFSLDMRLPDDAILVARSLGPAELLDYGGGRLKGEQQHGGCGGGGSEHGRFPVQKLMAQVGHAPGSSASFANRLCEKPCLDDAPFGA